MEIYFDKGNVIKNLKKCFSDIYDFRSIIMLKNYNEETFIILKNFFLHFLCEKVLMSIVFYLS